jgi:hypothetical protein
MARTRLKTKGRGDGEPRFVKLIYPILTSPAWMDLSPESRCLFIELMRRHNGSNNGEISLSAREAGEVAHCSKNTASKKLLELQTHGFITAEKKGIFTYRMATTWRITSERTRVGVTEKSATNEWKLWTAKKPVEVLAMR